MQVLIREYEMANHRNQSRLSRNGHPKARAASKLNRSLIEAAGDGNVAKIETLLADGADVNFQNEAGETPLAYAAAWNHFPALKALLQADADPNIADKTGGTPIMLAAQHGTAPMVRLLLAYGADPRAIDNAGYTALAHVQWRPDGDKEAAKIKKMLSSALRAPRKTAAA
jgi:ankyrin repeat protein